MKRTQLYLDEDMARVLTTLSRQQGTTVSELVRKSVRETYMSGKRIDRAAIAQQLAGIWAGRKDLRNIQRIIRKLRCGTRQNRLEHV